MAAVAEKISLKIRPLGDRALVERVEADQMSSGGIVLPGKEKPQKGVIVATGPGSKDKDGKICPLTVKVGDKIVFGKYSGSEITLDGKDYVVVREDDIIGIIE
jgi:chaperonin GroES